jgi:hypothetical protein
VVKKSLRRSELKKAKKLAVQWLEEFENGTSTL